MKYFMVTVKFGHVGKSNFYKGNLYIKAESKKEAAEKARYFPRVKHDHKDAILNVEEIDKDSYREGLEKNRAIRYFSCYNVQEQRECFCEIEDAVFQENRAEEYARHSKRRSLRKNYNVDPEYDYYKNKRNIDLDVA